MCEIKSTIPSFPTGPVPSFGVQKFRVFVFTVELLSLPIFRAIIALTITLFFHYTGESQILLNSSVMLKVTMDIDSIKDIVAHWAKKESLVTKAFIFGSRARKDYQDDSDLDVAIEIEKSPGDENKLATWICEKQGLNERLSIVVPYKVQLEHLNGEKTPTVLKGIKESNILVYDKSSY